MSTQISQYLIYGIVKPFEWGKEWEAANGKLEDSDGFYSHFESFMDDSAFEDGVKHKDGIFCLFDGRDGRYIIVGRVLSKARDGCYIGEGKPVTILEPTALEREFITNSIERNFGLREPCGFHFVTHFS